MLQLRHIFLHFVLVLLVGCSSVPTLISSSNEINSPDVTVALEAGRIRQTCLLSCAGTSGASAKKARSLHDNKSWADLAALVARIGYDSDLDYYYLGRSAESQGFRKAAIVYYRLSIANNHPCAGFINNCSGFNLPSEALTRLDQLLQVTDALATSAVPSPKPASTGVTPLDSNSSQVIKPARIEELQYGANVQTSYDEFKKLTNIKGSKLEDKTASIFLRAWKYDTGSTKFQLYVSDRYGGQWRFYADAWDADGRKIPLTLISRDVNCSKYGCTYKEDVGIEMERDYLQTHSTSGIRLKISGNGGEVIIAVPATYIAALLEAAK